MKTTLKINIFGKVVTSCIHGCVLIRIWHHLIFFLLYFYHCHNTAHIVFKQKVLLIHNDQIHNILWHHWTQQQCLIFSSLCKWTTPKLVKNKGHVLTDTSNGTRTSSLKPQLMQQMWWLTMEECLIILKALYASYTLPTRTFERKHVKEKSPVKQLGILADLLLKFIGVTPL